MTVPVFISYHGKDAPLASELKATLEKLSDGFNVFLDKDSIPVADDWETTIADAIKKAEWFIIICTGFPRRDADIVWPWFEAGQFRATLKQSLVPHANKRIVCLYDTELPSILFKFQGVKVCGRQSSGANADLLTLLGKDNPQLEESAIFRLLEQMLENAPDGPLRDVNASSTRLMLREEAYKLITIFEAAGSGTVRFEKSLQPRLSFELPPNGRLTSDTVVKGYDHSLSNLFSIETDETTWSRIVERCSTANGGKPGWLSDIEAAANDIMNDDTPTHTSNKCILRNVVYRVYAARYEIYKNESRTIYIGFLPASSRPFDLTRRSSTLLSSLILSVRFREQIIPLAKVLRETSAETVGDILTDFYRLLVSIEIEAIQFGLVLDTSLPDEETPLAAVFSDPKKKRYIRDAVKSWAGDRSQIETMFVEQPINLELPAVAKTSAKQIADILDKISGVNATFIQLIAEELLKRIKEGEDNIGSEGKDRNNKRKSLAAKRGSGHPSSRKAKTRTEAKPASRYVPRRGTA
jgi:hypothetical protein